MMKKLQPNFTALQLYGNNGLPPAVIKVGILPFLRPLPPSAPLRVMVMKPFAEKEILGSPKFQIAKGTRRINISGSWCDMRLDDLEYADESFHESLVTTALREGNEEIGLKENNIKGLFDLGGFTFISASKGVKKLMHLFAAEIIDPLDFSGFEATTSETAWMTNGEFAACGREDHIVIVREAVERLEAYFIPASV